MLRGIAQQHIPQRDHQPHDHGDATICHCKARHPATVPCLIRFLGAGRAAGATGEPAHVLALALGVAASGPAISPVEGPVEMAHTRLAEARHA